MSYEFLAAITFAISLVACVAGFGVSEARSRRRYS
jgi:hypothetical protein